MINVSQPMKNSRKFATALRGLADELDKLPEQLLFDGGRLYSVFNCSRIGVTLIQHGYKEDGWPDEPVQKVSIEVPVPTEPKS